MSPPTRGGVMQIYHRFLNALPHIGPKGLDPALRLELQVNPDTHHRMVLDHVVDPDDHTRFAGHPIVCHSTIKVNRFQFALVSNPNLT